jgi:hypothetical protein
MSRLLQFCTGTLWPGRRGWRAILVIAFFAFSSMNLHPVESDPDHGHVVVGGSDADRAHALTVHLARMRLHPETDGDEHPAPHAGRAQTSCPIASTDEPDVISIHGEAASIASFGAGGAAVASATPALLPPNTPAGPLFASTAAGLPDSALPPPEPPPRAS